MRLSEKHLSIIHEMEANKYIWLSHLSPNAIMRFRYKTQHGFKGYIKVEGLTFLTQRVAEMIEAGSKSTGKRRLTLKEQVVFLERQLAELEQELYVAKGLGKKKLKARLEDEARQYTSHKCCLCGGTYIGYGNSAEPINNGRCCDRCNMEKVIPTRLGMK